MAYMLEEYVKDNTMQIFILAAITAEEKHIFPRTHCQSTMLILSMILGTQPEDQWSCKRSPDNWSYYMYKNKFRQI